MIKFFTTIKIAGFVISFLAVFLPIYSSMIDKPDIHVDLTTTQLGNYTLAQIVIKNTGLEPATNVRITSNPDSNMINHTLTFYTEDIKFNQTGPRNLIATMNRLANGQEVDFNTLINSSNISEYLVFVTHDKGSTTYGKPQPISYAELILSLLYAIVASLAAGISVKTIVNRFEGKKIQNVDNNSLGMQDVDIINSNVQIHMESPQPGKSSTASINKSATTTSSRSPIQFGEQSTSPTESLSSQQTQIRSILQRIGKEKISNLLQESKIIAIDTKDVEMQKWIEQELVGFTPPDGTKLSRREAKERGLLPDYRDIKGKFLVDIGNLNTRELSYPVLFGNSIKNVENLIDLVGKGGRAFITHTFPQDVTLMGGQTVELDLTLSELLKIINGAEQKLSKFLESKLL